MNQYLYNLANHLLITHCQKHSIDCSGTHIIKQDRKQIYNLIEEKSGKTILTITFHKNSVPTYTYNPTILKKLKKELIKKLKI